MSERPPSSRWRAAAVMLGVAWAADRRRTLLAVGLLAAQSVAAMLFGLWLKIMLDGAQSRAAGAVGWAAAGMLASIAGSSALSYAAERVRRALTDRAQHAVELRLVELVGGVPTLDVHETPAHLTQLEALESESWEFGEVIPSIIELAAAAVRVATTALLLAAVHPLLLLLPLFGLPALLLSSYTGGLFQLGSELAAEPARRAGHLFDLATGAGPAKEVRLFRLGGELLARFHAACAEVRAIRWRLNVRGQLIGLATRLVFLVGYVGAIAFVAARAVAGEATPGDAALTAVLAGQLFGLVLGSAGLVQFAWRALASAGRFVYLEDLALAAGRRVDASARAPDRLADGIRLEGVSYRYPQAAGDTLHRVDLRLPAGATVAVVGDNGAGKTTLVKLLAGLYLPTEGRVLIDGADLARLDQGAWRRRVSAGFQDHARFELLVREAVGVGDLAQIDDPAAVAAALERAGAAGLADGLPGGLEAQLGASWPKGIDLSGGQWQKLAVGRAMMRRAPLLLLLDEPAAALDADSEHELFARWAGAASRLRRETGGVTVLVSHRFSTVRMADLIVVLAGGRVAESGTHAELMARGRLYAELFELQARSYR